MPDYITPGVYCDEIPDHVHSIYPVETAIPVFIGYTQMARSDADGDLLNIPKRISSLIDYVQFFGGAEPEKGITINVDTQKTPVEIIPGITNPSNYLMYYSLQTYFANGGAACYIVSVGEYSAGSVIDKEALIGGLKEAGKVDEITLIIFPDGTNMEAAADYYTVVKHSLEQCNSLKDRFTICDVYMHNDNTINDVSYFRNAFSDRVYELSFGAAYYPYLEMKLVCHYELEDVLVIKDGITTTLDIVEHADNDLFVKLTNSIGQIPFILPPSSSVAGIYAQIDRNRGVWKAPANINVSLAVKPTVNITEQENKTLNVDINTGLSINAIRSFAGSATKVWGGRTLAGNDNDWRYISVRRLFNMVEESVKKGTQWVVFEPNDANTWTRLRSVIEYFLYQLWREGALSGSNIEHAFYVRVGQGATMSASDILEGRLIVEIGMAAIRPAEFITLRFQHQMIASAGG